MFRYRSVSYTLLRNRKQRIEVAFLRNQFIESSRFNNRTVFQSDDTIVSFKQTFIQGVCNNDTCNAIKTNG